MPDSPLTSFLRSRIDANGPSPFPDFMAAALYHPEHGYYTGSRSQIGRSGDFFTNVSVGPLFGKLLGLQFAEMWERLGKPEVFTIVEQGAHSGDFARDVLSGLSAAAPKCFDAARYVIVEPSESLREKQAKTLSSFGSERVQWHRNLDELAPFEGVHFSNELLDAFPVHRVVRRAGQWLEQCVGWVDGNFAFVDGPVVTGTLSARLAVLGEHFADGYETEVNVAALDWVEQLAGTLSRGWILVIDYGYPRAEFYRPERSGGTLSGYANHQRVENILENPGESDLTAHVDFTSVAEAAEKCGLQLCGFTDQHHFMVGLSRLHFRDTDQFTPELERELRAFKTLMHPNMMGTSFKVLCLEKGVHQIGVPRSDLAGFAFASDSRAALGMNAE